MLVKNLAPSEIKIGFRHRRDLGDLKTLAASIETEGLLQPIGVTRQSDLVFGMRRLLACRDILKWKQLPCAVVDVTSLLAGEHAENEVRKDFTLSERDSIRRALEEAVKERRGRPIEEIDVIPGNSPEIPKGEETRDFTAKAAGFNSTDEARAVRRVAENGSPELIRAMDSGKIPVSVAAKLATLPKPAQQKAIAGGKQAIKAAVKQAAEEKKPDWAKGPSPQEEAKNDPETRWHRALHDLYCLLNSVRDNGGIAKLTSKWTPKGRKEYAAELKDVAAELGKWITVLEKSK